MAADLKADLCVIGGGSAGLSVAATAAQLGVKVVLIERDRMGGECLNTGCVPSKALLAAAKAAHGVRQAGRYGIHAEARVDFGEVHRHVRAAIAAIAPHDSQQRFENLGVQVLRAEARFAGPRLIRAGGRQIRARRVVIATGAGPALPPIPGLGEVPYLTNETVFDCTELPRHLIMLGGGPLAVELAQAFCRLGSAVTIIERSEAMPKDDRDLSRRLLRRLVSEGVVIREKATAKEVRAAGGDIEVTVEEASQTGRIVGSHLLVATGRQPRIAGLGLDLAGVAATKAGITVDGRLRTTARGVYAAGDVVAGPRFTHAAAYQAGTVIRNALFRLPSRVDYASLPWVTYTDPELAQVGLTEAQAREQHGDGLRVIHSVYADNDRAQAERQAEGELKLIVSSKGHVLGASILGSQAGELASLWVLAIEQRLKLRHIAGMFAPYPTWSELNKAAAAEYVKPSLFGPLSRRIVRMLSWWP